MTCRYIISKSSQPVKDDYRARTADITGQPESDRNHITIGKMVRVRCWSEWRGCLSFLIPDQRRVMVMARKCAGIHHHIYSMHAISNHVTDVGQPAGNHTHRESTAVRRQQDHHDSTICAALRGVPAKTYETSAVWRYWFRLSEMICK